MTDTLFTQLAQQARGELPAPIVPWLAPRFAQAAFTPEALVPPMANAMHSVESPIATPRDVVQAGALPGHATSSEFAVDALPGHAASAEFAAGALPGHVASAEFAPALAAHVAERAGTALEAPPHLVALRAQAPALPLPTIAPVMPPAGRSSAPTSAPPLTTTVVPALPSLHAAAGPFAAAPPPAPVIHVSIGRVEVRAISRAPEPPRREREAVRPEAQSLAAYLGKGRREP